MSDAKTDDSVELEELDLAAVAGLPTRSAEGEQVDAYTNWVDKHALTESDAQYMAERMMLQWHVRPSFHALVVLTRGEEEALADTLDSLSVQFYKDWGLSILSAEAPPPGWQHLPNVEWLQSGGSALEAVNAVVMQSGADWFVRLEAGVRLAPEALFSWVDHLNLHPSWRLIYSDEDSIDAAGNRCDPLFKPDFNLGLLRSMPYLGDVLPVEGGILRTLGGFSGPEGALSYDLALRVLDVAGADAIGHVSKVLVHRPRRFTRARDPLVVASARCEALASHLARCGVQATVGAGVLPDTFCVEYPTKGSPRASIVVVERPAGSAVAESVGSILQRTTYPDFEVVVVRGAATPDLPPDPRVRTVMGVGGTLAQRCNAGAAVASGEFLVFLDNEGQVAHEDWLTRLVANGQQPGVGVVGGRIVDASQRVVHAGFILGLHGTVGSPARGEPLGAPGYMSRLQVAQDVGAVSGACLLIRGALFESLGGLDDVHFPELFPDVDLCLRAAERGFRTVWTPFVTLVGEPRRLAVDSAGAAAERESLYGRWLPHLAADPAHNRHLSLTDPGVVVETEVDPTWEAPFRPRPRVLAFPLDAGACGHYRVWGPLKALDSGARAQCSLLPIHGMQSTQTRVPNLPELLRADPDTLLVQHGYFDLFLDWLKRYRAHSRALIVFGQDDNLFDVPEKNSLKKRLIGDLERRMAEALRHCDRLIVTTEPLVDVYRRLIDDVRVVPNHLDGARWGGLQSLRRVGRKPRVGWAGAMQHLGDLDWLEPVVRRLSREVEWVFMGMCPENLRSYVAEFHDPVPFDCYPAKLATLDLDLAIAPLEIHRFNEGKSDLRILEYGALGWPVVATDIYPYQGKPVTCLSNDPGRWIAAIRERVNDLDALAAEGDRLRDWVLGTRTVERNLDTWMQALFGDEVLRTSRPSPALAA
jgi:glycosyltransferase involved in cell wall biosynthesis